MIYIGGEFRKEGYIQNESKEFEDLTSIPDEMFGFGNSICLYDDIAIVVTGGEDKDTCTADNNIFIHLGHCYLHGA